MGVPVNVVVDLWQVSQAAVVGIWLVGLAKPAPPILWQDAQPVVIPTWLNLAPVKVLVLWHSEHSPVLGWAGNLTMPVARVAMTPRKL